MAEGIAEKIRKMAEVLDEEHIARALGISADVVRGVFKGEIPDEILSRYDPSRPPDVRIVEQKKFVRSKIIGVLSTGGAGATTVTATLAVLSAERSDLPVAAVDLNEYSYLASAMGLDVTGEQAAFYPNVLWWDTSDVQDTLIRHPGVENLSLVIGAVTAERHGDLKAETAAAAMKSLAGTHGLVWVDCPTSPATWREYLPLLDLLIFVVRPDMASLSAFWQAQPLLRGQAVALIINGENENTVPVPECRKMLRKAVDAPVLGVLPKDPDLCRAMNGGRCYVLERPNTDYARAAEQALDVLYPDRSTRKRDGLLSSLAGIFKRS